MTLPLPADLREATLLTKAGQLNEATAALQRMLAGGTPGPEAGRSARHSAPTIDGVATATEAKPTALAFRTRNSGAPLNGGEFLSRSFSNQAGSRAYKLYVPGGYNGQPVPLIVMLHGCSQSPDDFAAGTRMNAAAEAQTCLVAYPAQTSAANMQKCWNWFNAADQQRDTGEPSLIAGITRQVMRDYAVDPRHVFIAGLSAGGAAAAVLGETYPDLYAAIGVHSGLACGAAHDMSSAFAAMQGNGTILARPARPGAASRIVPAIVFHGDRDNTVRHSNADAVVTQSHQGDATSLRVETGRVPGGLKYSRTLHADASGATVVEQWVIHGAGHAWSGGSPTGSYTLPDGPDATGEMLRFFLEHPHPAITHR